MIIYFIKYKVEGVFEDVYKFDVEIKLEKDMIDLLKVDWVLVMQLNWFVWFVDMFKGDLKLQLMDLMQIIQLKELLMMKVDVGFVDVEVVGFVFDVCCIDDVVRFVFVRIDMVKVFILMFMLKLDFIKIGLVKC